MDWSLARRSDIGGIVEESGGDANRETGWGGSGNSLGGSSDPLKQVRPRGGNGWSGAPRQTGMSATLLCATREMKGLEQFRRRRSVSGVPEKAGGVGPGDGGQRVLDRAAQR